jgi:hypothetical protein
LGYPVNGTHFEQPAIRECDQTHKDPHPIPLVDRTTRPWWTIEAVPFSTKFEHIDGRATTLAVACLASTTWPALFIKRSSRLSG